MKRPAIFLFLLLFFSLSVFATPTPETSQRITVLMGPSAPTPSGFILPDYALAQFNKDFPNVEVVFNVTPTNVITEAMTTALAANDAPNVYMDYIGRVSTYIVPEYALDLRGYVRDLHLYYEGMLDAFTRGDAVLGLPGLGGAQGMAVNMDIMKEIGFTPRADWTIEDFLRMCELVKQKYSGEKWGTGMFAANQSGDYLINNWFAAVGAKFYAPGDYSRTTIATNGAKVYELFQTMARQGYIRADAAVQTDDDYVLDWANGKLGATAFFPAWLPPYFGVIAEQGNVSAEHLALLEKAKKANPDMSFTNLYQAGLVPYPFEVQFFPFPRTAGVDRVPTYTSIAAIVVHKTGTDADIWGARFAEYMNDGKSQSEQSSGGVLPNRRDAPMLSTDPLLLQVQSILAKNGAVDQGGSAAFFNATRVLHYPVLQKVLDLKITPEAAIKEYESALNRVLSDY